MNNQAKEKEMGISKGKKGKLRREESRMKRKIMMKMMIINDNC